MNVVIIDDEADIGYILGFELKFAGHAATNFDSVEKAKIYIEENIKTIDAIICDFQMPTMNGLEIFNWSREMDYKGQFYILTGEPNMDAESLLKSGISQVLYKPQDLVKLPQLLKP